MTLPGSPPNSEPGHLLNQTLAQPISEHTTRRVTPTRTSSDNTLLTQLTTIAMIFGRLFKLATLATPLFSRKFKLATLLSMPIVRNNAAK